MRFTMLLRRSTAVDVGSSFVFRLQHPHRSYLRRATCGAETESCREASYQDMNHI
jgi:hypothetical protein